VPQSLREASLALGAEQGQKFAKNCCTVGNAGNINRSYLSVGRAAGEPAPIMFTAVTFYTRRFPNSIMDEVMALPYHIYALMTEGTFPERQTMIAYGCALILLFLVLIVSGLAIYLRQKQRKYELV
jgi:phosphate transport system permease protein